MRDWTSTPPSDSATGHRVGPGQGRGASADLLRRAQYWALANSGSTILLIAWNYVAGAGLLFDETIGEISDRYDTSFTPADYAFGIWGLIYFALLVLVGRQLKLAFVDGKRDVARVDSILRLGSAFFVAQVFCGLWLWAWLSQLIVLSFLLMVCLWLALSLVIFRWNLERWDAPWNVIVTQWWPISLYAGWISVALLANLGATLASLGIGVVETPAWAIGIAALLVAFNLAMIFRRNMREFASVAVWALIALAVRHDGGPLEELTYVASGGALVLILGAAYHGLKFFTWPPRGT